MKRAEVWGSAADGPCISNCVDFAGYDSFVWAYVPEITSCVTSFHWVVATGGAGVPASISSDLHVQMVFAFLASLSET